MRVATFNIENLDESENPSFQVRASVLRPQLNRIDADILCLQEVHGQEQQGQKRDILVLRRLLKNTKIEARILIDEIFDAEAKANILICGDFNAHSGEVPIEAIIGNVQNTGNSKLVDRVMIPTENSVAESKRYSHIHHGKGNLLDHMLMSRNMVNCYKGAEIHNEILFDESVAYAYDTKFPESDHAPFVAEYNLS